MKVIELTTKRLKLRQWKKSDLSEFCRINADPVVMEYYPNTLNHQESIALAHKCESLISKRGWGFWAVEHLKEAQFIGFVGLHKPTADLPFTPCTEIGWRLAKEYWGKGYATEAAQSALKFAFETLNLDEVYSFTSVINKRSQAVMNKLNMSNSLQNFEHPDILPGNPLREHVLFKISKQNW